MVIGDSNHDDKEDQSVYRQLPFDKRCDGRKMSYDERTSTRYILNGINVDRCPIAEIPVFFHLASEIALIIMIIMFVNAFEELECR